MIIEKLDNFKVTYNRTTNIGDISDNGFLVKFSISAEQGIMADEPLDDKIDERLYSLLFKYVDWKVLRVFGSDEWKSKVICRGC